MAIELLRRRPPSELLPSKAAIKLIQHFEGLRLVGYGDAIGIATVGYGHTGPEVVIGKQITLAEAEALLESDVAKHAQIVRDHVQVPLTQSEFDALTALAFNLGYIPRSMKACLNGGTTDKGKVMAPGSYGSAMYEFPRNCRAGGRPLKGLYRRRLAEACVFNDLPWENACSITVIKFELTDSGEIDADATTTLEDTLMRARMDIPDARPDPTPVFTKNWPDLTPPPKPEATVTIIEDRPELVLTTPAAPVSVPVANAGQPEPQPSQAPAVPAPSTKPAVAVAPSAPAGPVASGPTAPQPPQTLPVPVPKPVDTKPPEQLPAPLPPPRDPLPVDLVDPKDMILSRRFWGLAVTAIGTTHIIPANWSKWLANESTREIVSWIAVVAVGVILYQWGKVKAKRPLK